MYKSYLQYGFISKETKRHIILMIFMVFKIYFKRSTFF